MFDAPRQPDGEEEHAPAGSYEVMNEGVAQGHPEIDRRERDEADEDRARNERELDVEQHAGDDGEQDEGEQVAERCRERSDPLVGSCPPDARRKVVRVPAPAPRQHDQRAHEAADDRRADRCRDHPGHQHQHTLVVEPVLDRRIVPAARQQPEHER